MDLQKLQYFLCVANSASMEEAAALLNVSQSTLSMAIKRLEEELGVALFRRNGRRKELTGAGEALQTEAAALLVHAENIRQQMRQFQEGPVSQLIIAPEAPDFTAAAAILYRDRDATFSTVQNLPQRNAVKPLLQSGRADFALTLFDDSDSELSSELLFSEPLLLLIHSEHPLARCERIDFRQIQHETLVSLPEGYAFRFLCEYFFAMNGARVRRVHELRDPEMTPRAVADGFGVGFYPHSLCSRDRTSDIAVVGVDGNFLRRQLYLTRLKNRQLPPETEDFFLFLRELGRYFSDHGHYPASADELAG